MGHITEKVFRPSVGLMPYNSKREKTPKRAVVGDKSLKPNCPTVILPEFHIPASGRDDGRE